MKIIDNHEEQERNEINREAASPPSGQKGPNLFKNRKRRENPAGRPAETETGNPDGAGDSPANNAENSGGGAEPQENGFFSTADETQDSGMPPRDDGYEDYSGDGYDGFETGAAAETGGGAEPQENDFFRTFFEEDADFKPGDGGMPPQDNGNEGYEDYSGGGYDGFETGAVEETGGGAEPQENGSFPTFSEEDAGETPDGGAREETAPLSTIGDGVPEKISASQAMKGSRPLQLNRTAILGAILGFFCLSFLFTTFILPEFKKKKAAEAAQRKKLEQNAPTDYSLYAQRGNGEPDFDNPYYDEGDGEDIYIPDPLEYRAQEQEPQPEYRQQPANTGTAGGGGRPDTRNDRLQGKSISGIKGLTPSRQNYAAPDQTSPFTAVPGVSQPPSDNPYAQFGLPPKNDYLNSILAQYQNPMASPGSGGGAYAAQNSQSGKTSFMNQGRENPGGGLWLPPNSVWQGSIFEATLTSDINTDLPGECTAWITKNVYSSLDGQFLLIPQNSRLFGSYNSAISYAQSRVQIGWHTLVRPDGYMINLGNMQGTDPRGAAGLSGFINEHPFAYLKAIGLLTALNIINSEFQSSIDSAQNQYVQNVMANSQDMSNRLADRIIDRALDIQPTIIIRAGAKINIVANQHLVLPPLPPYGVIQAYHRGE